MKTLGILSGLLIIGLLIQCGLAENKRKQRQAYLPPRANNAQITEEYITVEEEHPSSQGQFQESNFGDSKYEIFEVHSHYEPTTNFNAPQSSSTRQELQTQNTNQIGGINLAAPNSPVVSAPLSANYQRSPAETEEVIHIQHIHINTNPVSSQSSQQSNFKAADYLPPLGGNDVASLPQSEYRAPDYLPPLTKGNHEHHHEHHNHHHQQQQQHKHQVEKNQVQHQQIFRAPDYLPPADTHSHHHEHHQQHQQQIGFRAPDYSPPHHEIQTANHQGQQVHFNGQAHQHEAHTIVSQAEQFRGPDYLPPQHGANHQNHQVQFNGQNQHHETQAIVSQAEQFRGPDYLPPHHGANHQGQQVQFNGQNQQHETQAIVSQVEQFRGPDYLPPHHETQTAHQQSQQVLFSGQNQHHEAIPGSTQAEPFRGPDYLPPHHETQIANHQSEQVHFNAQNQHHEAVPISQIEQFRGPDYLPPHHEAQIMNHQSEQLQYNGQNQHQKLQSIVSQVEEFRGPDYLPPHHEEQNVQFKGPDYLPPHHEAQQHHQNNLQDQFKGPDYLPPHNDEQHINHQQNQERFEQSTQFKGPDYLPPHGPSSSPQSVILPNGYDYSNSEKTQAPQQTPFQQSLTTAQQLPPGYDFEKPENSEQAIAELHSLPNEEQNEVVVQSQIQVGQSDQEAQIIYGQRQSDGNHHQQHNGYLPPHNGAQQATAIQNYQVQQGNVQTLASATSAQQFQRNLQQVAPQSFEPAPVIENVAQSPVVNLPPPAKPVQADQFSSNLHSLSSYMTGLKPFERYGNAQFTAPRRPFREYGPPPSNGPFSGANSQQQQQQQEFQPIQQLPVAPMYREQASRSPYYAPAMSYASNAVANTYTASTTSHHHHHHHQQQQSQSTSFTQQTRHNLQQLMPADVQYFKNAPAPVPAPAPAPAPRPTHTLAAPTVPVHQSSSGKIRTVQIVNPSAVKTLKVLETSDHAGVKTIKILGHSNTNPTGEHHVIKVVTQNGQNAQEHVQTVKIFKDHVEAPRAIGTANAYLPPQVRVIRKSPLKLQLISKSKHRHFFTQKNRYRA